jgi:predicted DNA-binding transcriptional regulator YafY
VVRISRLERITNLVLALLHTSRPLSLREIGAEVAGYPKEAGALRQAFERDKRTLRDGGIPVHVERIDGDEQVGYRILPEEYYLPDLELLAEEEDALAFALAAVRVEGAFTEALAARFGATRASVVPAIAVLPELPALGTLHEALRTRAALQLTYHGRRRTLFGYGLAFRSGRWYFVAAEHDGDREVVKTFRVDRIEDTPSLGNPESYVVPEGFDIHRELQGAPFAGGGEDATSVRLAVDRREAPQLLRLFGDDAVVGSTPDDRLELVAHVGDEEAFVAYLLGLGESVELLEPAELRSALVAALRARAGRRTMRQPRAEVAS